MYEFIKEKEIENIVLEHIVNSKKVEENAKDLIKHAFEQAISIILLQVKQHIESSNQYKMSEDIYKDIIDLKEEMVEYAKLPYSTEPVKESELEDLRGIFKTVFSSLDEFPDHEDNSIEYERTLIVSTGLLKIKEVMNEALDKVVYEFKLPTSLIINLEDVISKYLLEQIRGIYKELKPLIEEVILKLNNYDERSELNSYYEFIRNLNMLIGSYTSFKFEISTGDESLDLTAKYITPLIGFEEKMSTMLSVVDYCKNSTVNETELNIIKVDEIVMSNLNNDERLKELYKVLEQDKRTTTERVIIHISSELSKVTTINMNKLKKASSVFELLSCVILELFEETLQCVSQHDTTSVEGGLESKIIKGVEDTLHLKYASLKEKDEEYHLKKKEDFLVFGEQLIAFENEFNHKIEDLLDEAIEGSVDGFLNTQAKFNHLAENLLNENLSKDLDFMRKDVLFEIKTLEDLIENSIIRLKESEDVICHEFAGCIDTLYDRILLQLKRSDVLQIVAKPHETFNGKIHEVLMTESNDEYNKGEIIRSRNSGFIYGAHILQRASVIVAK